MPYKSREQQRKYQLAWHHRRRAAYFADKVCVRCGSTEQLELDHINPADKTTHRIWSWSKERFAAEEAKCQVLCRPCHDIKTNEDFDQGRLVHGTENAYKYHNCRCRHCTDEAVRASNERRNRRKRERRAELRAKKEGYAATQGADHQQPTGGPVGDPGAHHAAQQRETEAHGSHRGGAAAPRQRPGADGPASPAG